MDQQEARRKAEEYEISAASFAEAARRAFEWQSNKQNGPLRIARHHQSNAEFALEMAKRWRAAADFLAQAEMGPPREQYLTRADKFEHPAQFLQRVYAAELSSGHYFQDMLRDDDPPLYAHLRKALARNRKTGMKPELMEELLPLRPDDLGGAKARPNELEKIEDRIRLHAGRRNRHP